MGRLVILYVDGSFGIGKTTALREIQNSDSYPFRRIFLEEPMRAWRSWFADDHDAIKEIYETQELKDSGAIDLHESSRRVCYAQLSLSAPFHIMNAVVYGMLTGEPEAEGCGPLASGDHLLCVDRHPIASCLCFPVARFVSGYLEYTDLISLVATLPDYPSHATIVLFDLSVAEQVRRIEERSRSGEQVDATFLRILRNVFVLVNNTVAYLRATTAEQSFADRELLREFRGSRFEAAMTREDLQPKDNPDASETLFAVFASDASWVADKKQSALFIYAMAKLDALMRTLNVFFLGIDGLDPKQCADRVVAISSEVRGLEPRGDSMELLFQAVSAYNLDMSV